jgi:antitoxin (DNA-binding transcriptional repressor) of toxin-antitoxin stability system
MTTTAEVNEFTGRLAELVKQVQAGNEVLLTQERKPVAKIIATSEKEIVAGTTIQIHSLKGHRVLTPVVAQSELADEMFARQ